MIDTQEQRVNNNSCHNKIFKCLRLDNLETLHSEAIDRFDWNNFRISLKKYSLNLDPFLLFITEIVSTLSLLDLLVKLIDNNRDEQIHDKECCDENVQDKDARNHYVVV